MEFNSSSAGLPAFGFAGLPAGLLLVFLLLLLIFLLVFQLVGLLEEQQTQKLEVQQKTSDLFVLIDLGPTPKTDGFHII